MNNCDNPRDVILPYFFITLSLSSSQWFVNKSTCWNSKVRGWFRTLSVSIQPTGCRRTQKNSFNIGNFPFQFGHNLHLNKCFWYIFTFTGSLFSCWTFNNRILSLSQSRLCNVWVLYFTPLYDGPRKSLVVSNGWLTRLSKSVNWGSLA